MSDFFSFRSFQVKQVQNAMKVGTDSVLLGSCATVEEPSHILDVGAGTGVLTLMMAQRSVARIDAIEIDEESWKECTFNTEASPWKNRIRTFQSDFQTFLPDVKYDLIISNPPYFSDAYPSPDEKRNQARHLTTISLPLFLKKCRACLKKLGVLALILPVEQAIFFEKLALEEGLHTSRAVRIHGKKGKMEVRRIMEFRFYEGTCSTETVVIENNSRHDYTKQYLALMRDFLFLE